MKLGIVQLRGAGDALITLPIAKYLYKKGHEIYWTIDGNFYEAFSYAAPYVNFIPVTADEKTLHANIRNPYWFETPRQLLLDAGCEEIISFPYEEVLHYEKIRLDSRLIDPIPQRAKNLKLPNCTTFDQFKYAACNVPFLEKWNLDIRRNTEREQQLYDKLVWDNPAGYVVTHLSGGMGTINYNMEIEPLINSIGLKNAQIINITPVTNNIFDWLMILERCSCFVGIDSFFVNLIDQMKLDITKFFIRRSPTNFTPVLGTGWDYLPINLASDKPHELHF